MGMVDGVGLIEWEGGLFDPAGDLLPRVRWVFTQMRAEGWDIELNEAGRPFGVFSDRYATSASGTASGRSTVNYQWGRYLRGETPSAANPAAGEYASNHTRGLSVDTNTNNMARRRELFAQVGMDFDIASESWHCTIYRPSTVDLSAFASGTITPIVEDDMFSDDDRQALNETRWMLGQIKPQTDKLTRIAVATDLVLWATTDPEQGLRRMVANLTALIPKVSSLSKQDAEAELVKALSPFTQTTIAAQTEAATVRVNAAAAEVAAAAPPKPIA